MLSIQQVTFLSQTLRLTTASCYGWCLQRLPTHPGTDTGFPMRGRQCSVYGRRPPRMKYRLNTVQRLHAQGDKQLLPTRRNIYIYIYIIYYSGGKIYICICIFIISFYLFMMLQKGQRACNADCNADCHACDTQPASTPAAATCCRRASVVRVESS